MNAIKVPYQSPIEAAKAGINSSTGLPFSKMKPAAKKAWVEALRSGEYEQTRSQLCRLNGRMCCLGVAYDAAIDSEWDRSTAKYGRTGWGVMEDDNGLGEGYVETSNLPYWVMERIGLDEDAQYILADLNDVSKWDFGKIADWIERNL